MNFRELVTYRFAKNVGPTDRVFRIISGAGLAGAGWLAGASLPTSIALLFAGVGWAATGVLSRCSIYYLVGYSSCPLQSPRTKI
jgi:hypothetical protein